MFERYTTPARRVVFFARYEASQFGSPLIEPEHILLGLIRDEKRLCGTWLPKATPEELRCLLEVSLSKQPATSVSIDLPLSPASRHVLKTAADEAGRLNSKFIGTQHLLLGVLQHTTGLAAK